MGRSGDKGKVERVRKKEQVWSRQRKSRRGCCEVERCFAVRSRKKRDFMDDFAGRRERICTSRPFVYEAHFTLFKQRGLPRRKNLEKEAAPCERYAF
jgi:hypothetical protein